MTEIKLKRIDDDQDSSDGYRIFLDRLWPRGLTKEEADYDEWRKDMTPSSELRSWFHEDPENNWNEFVRRYTAEIEHNPDLADFKEDLKKHKIVTFLTASKDLDHCQLPVLKKSMEKLL